jgi:hypothetical protein
MNADERRLNRAAITSFYICVYLGSSVANLILLTTINIINPQAVSTLAQSRLMNGRN